MSSGSFVFSVLGQLWYYRKLWFVTSFGIAFLLLAYIFAFEEVYLQNFGKRAQGVVVKLIETEATFTDSDGKEDISILLTPVVTYTDHNSQNHTVKSKSSRDSYNFSVGDQINIYYHPEDTKRMVIGEGLVFNYVAGIIFSILGLIALIPLIRHISSVIRNCTNKVT